VHVTARMMLGEWVLLAVSRFVAVVDRDVAVPSLLCSMVVTS
jgi:hypothetical protein